MWSVESRKTLLQLQPGLQMREEQIRSSQLKVVHRSMRNKLYNYYIKAKLDSHAHTDTCSCVPH